MRRERKSRLCRGVRWFGRGVTRARRSSAVVTRRVFGAGGAACSAGEGMQARRGAGAMRVGQREVRRPRGRRYAAHRAVCARWTKGLPLARRHKLCDGHIPRCTKDKKNIRTVGFEPTPSKRPVPETGALDRSARSARFSPLVCYITLANSPRSICFVCQKNPFSSFSPLRRRVPRLTPPHAWKPTRQGRSRALERSCALFSRGDARDVRELGA